MIFAEAAGKNCWSLLFFDFGELVVIITGELMQKINSDIYGGCAMKKDVTKIVKNFFKMTDKMLRLTSVALLVLYSGYFPDVIQTIMRIMFAVILYVISYALHASSTLVKKCVKNALAEEELTFDDVIDDCCKRLKD